MLMSILMDSTFLSFFSGVANKSALIAILKTPAVLLVASLLIPG